jgi:SAM-dependent methyltransferase
MRASDWDERYRTSELVWGLAPNRWVEQEVTDLSPGNALDLACGEGRNAVWLARQGWRVVALDFSAVAVTKGKALEAHELDKPSIAWVVADATTFVAAETVDLALLCYLQLVAVERRAAVRRAAEALAPGGTLLVVGHDSRNLADGTGGPQDASVLFTAADVAADLEGTGLVVEKAIEVLRPVEGADRPAIDALLRAVRRPSTR